MFSQAYPILFDLIISIKHRQKHCQMPYGPLARSGRCTMRLSVHCSHLMCHRIRLIYTFQLNVFVVIIVLLL